jgi:hypothetical protein
MTPLLLCALLASETPEALLARLQPVVAEIRGLPFERPVAVRTATPAEARAHFAERARQLWPEPRARLEQRVYEQLGLLPAGYDLRGSLLDVLEEQALGYYDPGSDVFTLVEGALSSALAPVLVVHELTHALDDQHFDLEALLASAGDDDDRAAAAAAVVEGSGTAVMSLFLLREVGAGRLTGDAVRELQRSELQRAERLGAAPLVVQRGLLGSYLLGMAFLLRGNPARLLGGLPAADLDRAFREPPRTTEQVLHPEKYWDEGSRDVTPALALPDLSASLGPGWSLRGRGNLGELLLAALAGHSAPRFDTPEAAAPARWTSAAAAGTAGDVFHHYADGDRSVTLLLTRWDGEREAQEFQAGLTSLPRDRSYRAGPGVAIVAGDARGADAERLAAAALQAVID